MEYELNSDFDQDDEDDDDDEWGEDESEVSEHLIEELKENPPITKKSKLLGESCTICLEDFKVKFNNTFRYPRGH